MQIFIDESGNFTPSYGVSAVCALALPHETVVSARAEIAEKSKKWPRVNRELKGASLSPAQLAALIHILFNYDALLICSAIDVAREPEAGIDAHRLNQAVAITRHITPEHYPTVVEKLWELRRAVERMSNQLYVQSVLMRELVVQSVEVTTMYFAQRRPQDLATFEWVIDAKDPTRITRQEEWYRDTLGGLVETRTEREPITFVRDDSFNYEYFDRSFSTRGEVWRPNQPLKVVDGIDLRKLVLENVTFAVSQSDILIQVIDILSSHVRRALAGKIGDHGVIRQLGRLQVRRKRDGVAQTVQLCSLTGERDGPRSYGMAVRLMYETSRVMLVRSKTEEQP